MRRIALLLITFFSLRAGAQQPFIRDFSLNEIPTGVKVNALVQDSTGYIWIATDNGLAFFNGRNFVKIQDSIHQPVTAVAAGRAGVWVGYKNGAIGKVFRSAVRKLSIVNGPSSSITSLYARGKGVLWAGTEEQGIFVIRNDTASAINTSKGLSDNFVYDLSINGDDRVIAGSDMGINDISLIGNNPAVTVCSSRQGLPDNIVSVIRNIPGTQLYWVGTQEGGLAIYSGSEKKVFPITPPSKKWSYGQVNDILPVSARRAWVATEEGYLLEIVLADGFNVVVHPYYYPGKNFKKLLLDKAGNIWCGSGHGLSMITGEYLSGIKLSAPYSLQDVTAIAWSNDVLWIALKRGLYQVSLTDSLHRLVLEYTSGANISSLYNDKNGRLWIGTLGAGLYYRQGGSVTKVKGIEGLDDDGNVLNITGTGNSIWVAGLKGVDELSLSENGVVALLKHQGKKTGMGSDYVYQLYPDHKGNMWMATDGGGVCMYDGNSYRHWDTSFGANGKVVYSITEDDSGNMWAGTMYKDLFRFHNNTWENMSRLESPYADNSISTVTANATGQVIAVYQACIDVWYPQSRYFRHFNSALGIGIDSTSNVLNCATKDSYGNVFVPFPQGVLIFKNQSEVYDIRPGVHITTPTIFSRPVSSDRTRFDYDENYVGFAFDGIGFANHERLNYRYKLEGYNDGWIYTSDASASFPKLSSGHYKFRVQVSLNPSFENPNEDSYEFTIGTPFWRTNLFYCAMVLLAILVGYLYVTLREKRLQRISRLQQERIMFEYEHLKSQVNPHFLFNSLYALSILIEEKKENALSYTVHLADLYRNMLSSGRNDLIPLDQELNILNDYNSIQQTRFEDAFVVKIDIPDEIRKTKQIVPLSLQFLVENAIKHNVVSAASPLTVYISATKDEITIRNAVHPKISKEKGEGIGLVNIKKRYALLTKKPITYGIFEGQFIVTLPLL